MDNKNVLASLFGGEVPPSSQEAVDKVLATSGKDDNNILPNDFYNAKDNDATQTRIREKPEHRLILMAKARGMSNIEIAEMSGYSALTVGQICRQPWARPILARLINEVGAQEVRKVLEGACVDSVYKLIDLRDAPSTPPAVVRQTCVDLIQQFMGKPTQQVEVKHNALESKTPEELDREIKALEMEANRLNGHYTS